MIAGFAFAAGAVGVAGLFGWIFWRETRGSR